MYKATYVFNKPNHLARNGKFWRVQNLETGEFVRGWYSHDEAVKLLDSMNLK